MHRHLRILGLVVVLLVALPAVSSGADESAALGSGARHESAIVLARGVQAGIHLVNHRPGHRVASLLVAVAVALLAGTALVRRAPWPAAVPRAVRWVFARSPSRAPPRLLIPAS
jgi:hypothetical protein